jgi:hypothetical protein
MTSLLIYKIERKLKNHCYFVNTYILYAFVVNTVQNIVGYLSVAFLSSVQ